MNIVPLISTQDLIKKTSSHALFPMFSGAAPASKTEVLVGYKKLVHGHKVDASKDLATIYQANDCLMNGLLQDASTHSREDTTNIHEPGNSFFYDGDHKLLALSVAKEDRASAFKIYYLPWGFDQMHGVTLGGSANYFITAALQGCSVYVAGTPAQPTVFHLNANAVTGGTPEESQKKKMKTMDERFLSAIAKLGVSKQGWRAATMEQYMPGVLSDSGEAQLRQEHGVEGLQWYHLKAKASRSFWQASDDMLLQYGTVFGVCESGKWAFYYQKRSRHGYDYKPFRSARKAYAEWTVTTNKFWPMD